MFKTETQIDINGKEYEQIIWDVGGTMNIKIVLEEGAKLPLRSTEGAAAWDLFAHIEEPIKIYPNNMRHSFRVLPYKISTGVRVELPKGYYWSIRSKSGLYVKRGISVDGGVIDEDYRGIVHVALINTSRETYTINPGDKIAQVVLQKYHEQEFEIVDSLEETERGEGGFGSTGK